MKKTFIDENGELNEWNGKLYPLNHAVKLAYGKVTKADIELWDKIAEEDEEKFYSEHPELRNEDNNDDEEDEEL